MRYITDSEYAAVMRTEVEPALAACRRESGMQTADGHEVVFESYEPACCRGSVLILHGFTESRRKYRELAWYLLQSGLAVYIPDQRGHGDSWRATDRYAVTHIDRFEEYVSDAEQLTALMRQEHHGKPLYLFGHSMGGAVAAFALERNPDLFAAAVLSSPMIAPAVYRSRHLLARAICRFRIRRGQGSEPFFLFRGAQQEWERRDPDWLFRHSSTDSPARFRYYYDLRQQFPQICNCMPSNGWLYEATGITPVLLDPDAMARVETPVLLCMAGRETLVSPRAQLRFAKGLKNCRVMHFPHSRHELYGTDDRELFRYLDAVIGMFGGGTTDAEC